MPTTPLINALAAAGYSVAFRREVWDECLVARGGERWVGRGANQTDALDDAVRAMFPSHVARRLLDAHLGHAPELAAGGSAAVAARNGSEAASPSPPNGAAVPVAAATGFAAPPPAVPGRTPAGVEPAQQPIALAAARSTDAAAARGSSAAAAQPSRSVEPAVVRFEAAPPDRSSTAGTPHSQGRAAVVAEARRAPPPAPSSPERSTGPDRARVEIALAAVDSLLEEIEAGIGDLARMPAERQRLWLHLWICWARAYEEQLPDHRDIVRSVSKVARRLTELCKIFWPGNVRALQLLARPADVAIRPQGSRGPAPETWKDAAGLAEKALEDHLERAKKEGLDDDGWADAASLSPPPARPDEVVAAVAAELEALSGPLGAAPGTVPELGPGVLARLSECGRALRWTRRAASDSERWGVLGGRLRWIAHGLGDAAGPLRDLVDAGYRPSAPWAKVAEHGQKEQKEQEAAEEMLKELPAPDAGKDPFVAWLIRAFEVMDTPRLAEAIGHRKEEICALEGGGMPSSGRRARRRLRELVQHLQSPRGEVVAAGAAASPPEPGGSTASVEGLAEKLRPHTKGRQALFAGTRDEADLEAKLSELLGLKLTFCDGSAKRVEAECERIAGRSYDFVLSATGFQNHTAEASLARATHAAKVPLVRVKSGRALACVQALARDLGLAPRG